MPIRFTLNHAVAAGVLVLLLSMQLVFAHAVRDFSVQRTTLPPPPSIFAQDALAMGDPQFLFRSYGLRLQMAGDTGGRVVPIKTYDFETVVGWLKVLQRLDGRSQFPLGIAVRYFGHSQDVEHVEPIVAFVRGNVDLYPNLKWMWLYDAIYLARHRLEDNSLALEAANQLASYRGPNMPPWASMAPAFILEDMGNFAAAREVIVETRRRFGSDLSVDDQLWTESYLDYLLKREKGLISSR